MFVVALFREAGVHEEPSSFTLCGSISCTAFLFSPGLTAPGGASPRGRLWRETDIGTGREAGVLDLTALYIITVCGSGFLALALSLIWSIVHRWEDKRTVQMAKKAEIGEGVTLLQGIRACFGGDGFWSALLPGLVYIYVDDPRLIFAVQVIRGPGRKYWLIPQLSDPRHHWAGIDERDAAFGVMVEAVKEQETMIEM